MKYVLLEIVIVSGESGAEYYVWMEIDESRLLDGKYWSRMLSSCEWETFDLEGTLLILLLNNKVARAPANQQTDNSKSTATFPVQQKLFKLWFFLEIFKSNFIFLVVLLDNKIKRTSNQVFSIVFPLFILLVNWNYQILPLCDTLNLALSVNELLPNSFNACTVISNKQWWGCRHMAEQFIWRLSSFPYLNFMFWSNFFSILIPDHQLNLLKRFLIQIVIFQEFGLDVFGLLLPQVDISYQIFSYDHILNIVDAILLLFFIQKCLPIQNWVDLLIDNPINILELFIEHTTLTLVLTLYLEKLFKVFSHQLSHRLEVKIIFVNLLYLRYLNPIWPRYQHWEEVFHILVHVVTLLDQVF